MILNDCMQLYVNNRPGSPRHAATMPFKLKMPRHLNAQPRITGSHPPLSLSLQRSLPRLAKVKKTEKKKKIKFRWNGKNTPSRSVVSYNTHYDSDIRKRKEKVMRKGPSSSWKSEQKISRP